MLQIRLSTDLPQLSKRLDLLTEKNLRYATSNAMKATAIAAKEHLKAEAAKQSGGPIRGGATRWTLGAIAADWPRPSNLEARIGFRSDTPRAAGKYLLPMIKGGPPRPKAVDLSAAKTGRTSGVVIQPTKSQRLTQQGNVSLSQYRTILGSARDKTPGGRYFLAPVRKGASTLAVFRRGGRGKGRLTALFVLAAPKSRAATFDLGGILNKEVAQAWPVELSEAINGELRRYGFR